MASIYQDILAQNSAKLLNLYNTDPHSPTYGHGDRLYWGWKVSDFANGTFQGGVHALAVQLKLGLPTNPDHHMQLIEAAMQACGSIMAKNGSFVEAYPREHSFCVSALVAFDVLSAMDILGEQLDQDVKRSTLEALKKTIHFITKNDEEHAIISNHLATGVAAITKWNKLTGDNNQRHQELLTVIYEHQSEEGWYKEYEGADPGYQTLCTYYLASAYLDTKDDKLLDSLRRSAAFLKHFVHVDGTIGGLYGSRNTEVYYPGGIVALAKDIPDFATIASGLATGVKDHNAVWPEDIDPGNYIPLLNSYAFAALNTEPSSASIEAANHSPQLGERHFKQAGLYVQVTEHYQAILNYHKGGALKVFDRSTSQIDLEEGGYFGRFANGKVFSSQSVDASQSFDNNRIRGTFYHVSSSLPTPFTTFVLRFFGMTIFRSLRLGNMFKRMIVKRLMTGKKRAGGSFERAYDFQPERIVISDAITKPNGAQSLGRVGRSRAIHMASSGYTMRQHVQRTEPKIVAYQET